MEALRDVWLVRGPFGDLEIVLDPLHAAADAERDASLRDLRHLLLEFRRRSSAACRAVLGVHARLTLGTATAPAGERDRSGGPSRAEAVCDELLFAARAGRLTVRRRERRSLVVPLDDGLEEVLGPASGPDSAPDSKTWVGLVLVDQDGTPVPGRPYRVVKPDGTTLDGTLDSHGAAMIRDLDAGNCQIWCPYVEPHAATTHTVAPGEHVSGIAQRFGFDDYKTVWNDPGNAELQQQRADPHVLQPGDALSIPEVKAQPAANKPTGAKHPFQIQRSPLKVRLKLLDLKVKPVPNASVTVASDALTTDGDGLVEATIDKSTTGAPLDTPNAPETHLTVGDLNPSDDASEAGYKARLYNLGFLWDPTVSDADDEMLIALEDFQAQYGLTMSRALDDATKAQILQAHGC
jgi:hypothetical protein